MGSTIRALDIVNKARSRYWMLACAGVLVWVTGFVEASTCLPNNNPAAIDSLCSLSRLTCSDGRFLGCGYDAEDRRTAVTDTYGRVYSFDWDAAGRLTGIHHPNSVNEVFTNDLADQVTSLSVTRGSTSIAIRRLAYDDAGRPIRQEMDAGLAPVPPTNTWLQHTHNRADRVVSSVGMYNGDRVTVGYGYDGCGSMTNRAWVDADVPAASFTNAFSYGPDGLATSCTLGTSTVSFTYSAGGVRVKESGASGTRYFAVNLADPFKRVLAELDANGATVRSYIWAGNRLLCMLDSAGVPRYAHGDVQGSVIALTDSSGNVTDQFAYGPYGELYRRTGSTDLPFIWLGGSGVRQLGDGLYATQHRLYDANIKRFIQADPKGIAGGLNLYAYGNLNPLVYVDPLGLEARSGIPSFTSSFGSEQLRMAATGWYGGTGVRLNTAQRVIAGVWGVVQAAAEVLALAPMLGANAMTAGGVLTRGSTLTATERMYMTGAYSATRAPTATRLAVPLLRTTTTSSRIPSLWKRTAFRGLRVYQRNDLINPSLVDKLGRSNLQRMKEGLAPLGADGKPINLHHMLQSMDSPIAEVAQAFHRRHTRIIHINPGTTPSGIDRDECDVWRAAYWSNRADDF